MKIFSKEQKLLLIQTRLALETEYQECNMNLQKISKLWQKVHSQLIEKDASMQNFTLRQIMHSYRSTFNSFKALKAKGASMGNLDADVFDMFDQACGHCDPKQCEIVDEIKQLVLNARLSRENEFRTESKNMLWREILQEVKRKAIGSTEHLTIRQIQQIFRNIFVTYRRQKSNANGRTWQYFEQMDEIYGHEKDIIYETRKVIKKQHDLVPLVLNARLPREAEFRENFRNTNWLWQEILTEIKTKAKNGCTLQITCCQIKNMFSNMCYRYKRHKSSGNRRCWPYFEQMDKVYGHSKELETTRTYVSDELKQLVLNARVSREAEFQKHTKRESIWKEILKEVKAKAIHCRTVDLNTRKLQSTFFNMLRSYKRNKCLGNRKWPYFEQMDKVYGNRMPFEIFTMTSFNEDAMKSAPTSNLFELVVKKTVDDRQMFQQICNIEKQKLQLQRQEIIELRKLHILLAKKEYL